MLPFVKKEKPSDEILDQRVNHAFMPVMVDPATAKIDRDRLHRALYQFNVMTRKYFYPSAADMTAYRNARSADPLAVARDASARVLALPIYADLSLDDVHAICDIIEHIQRDVAS